MLCGSEVRSLSLYFQHSGASNFTYHGADARHRLDPGSSQGLPSLLDLGIEALKSFVRKEPLRRVHECVFGVLAIESEPVDPKL